MDNHSLRRRASVSTFVSLVELDPTPIDSPGIHPNTDKELPPLPEDDILAVSPTTRTSATLASLGLSGTGHGAIYYLTRIQRYSSYTFSVFAGLHLATTSLIPLAARSVAASESYLLLAREIYQTPLSEPLIVALPVVAHVGAGLALRLVRRSQNLRRYYGDLDDAPDKTKPTLFSTRSLSFGWPHLTWIATSGYVFASALAAHVTMTRILPLVVEGDSANIGLAYIAHGFARHGSVSWVSYAVLLGAGCGHMVWGWAKWMGLTYGAGWAIGPTEKQHKIAGNTVAEREARRRRRRRLFALNAVAATATAVWAAGGLGVVARAGLTPGWVGKLYDGLFERIPGF
ncbi:hypothetical protein VTJ83DRAFT_1466 [Remersonia thermophila]|uniref:Mitochondrial adapter protein MCP1 transmembrane domain-containing protein n=1 Tax=Remersonia thermophila TaxID=72144 RepID=A0ABR4DI79_9PEZI